MPHRTTHNMMPLHLPRATTRTRGFHKGSMSKTHAGDMDFTTKSGDIDFHEGGHDEHRHRMPFNETRLHPERHQKHHTKVTREHAKPKPKAGHKGAKSKTRKGEMDYTTKKSSKDFHRGGHDEKTREGHKRKAKPFRKKGVKSKTAYEKKTKDVPYHMI